MPTARVVGKKKPPSGQASIAQRGHQSSGQASIAQRGRQPMGQASSMPVYSTPSAIAQRGRLMSQAMAPRNSTLKDSSLSGGEAHRVHLSNRLAQDQTYGRMKAEHDQNAKAAQSEFAMFSDGMSPAERSAAAQNFPAFTNMRKQGAAIQAHVEQLRATPHAYRGSAPPARVVGNKKPPQSTLIKKKKPGEIFRSTIADSTRPGLQTAAPATPPPTLAGAGPNQRRRQLGVTGQVALGDALRGGTQQRLMEGVAGGTDRVGMAQKAAFEKDREKERRQLVEELNQYGVLGGEGASSGRVADVLGEFRGQTNLGRLQLAAQGQQRQERGLERAIGFQRQEDVTTLGGAAMDEQVAARTAANTLQARGQAEAERAAYVDEQLAEATVFGRAGPRLTEAARRNRAQEGLAGGELGLRGELGRGELGERAATRLQQGGQFGEGLEEQTKARLEAQRLQQAELILRGELGRGELGLSGDQIAETRRQALERERQAAAGLTGQLDGQDTLAAQQLADQARLAEAGLTGQLDGRGTLAAGELGLRQELGRGELQLARSAEAAGQRSQAFRDALASEAQVVQSELGRGELGLRQELGRGELEEQEAARLEAQRLQSRAMTDESNRFRLGQTFDREQLAQQGEQFGRSASEQEAARLEQERLQSRAMTDESNRFRLGQTFDREQLRQQGKQFGEGLGEQTAARIEDQRSQAFRDALASEAQVVQSELGRGELGLRQELGRGELGLSRDAFGEEQADRRLSREAQVADLTGRFRNRDTMQREAMDEQAALARASLLGR